MIWTLLAFAVIISVDLYPLIKQKKWKEAAGTGGVLLAGLVLAVLYLSGVKIPSTLNILGNVLEKLHIGY